MSPVDFAAGLEAPATLDDTAKIPFFCPPAKGSTARRIEVLSAVSESARATKIAPLRPPGPALVHAAPLWGIAPESSAFVTVPHNAWV